MEETRAVLLTRRRNLCSAHSSEESKSDVADGEALERDGRLLRQSVRLLGRQLLGFV